MVSQELFAMKTLDCLERHMILSVSLLDAGSLRILLSQDDIFAALREVQNAVEEF